MKDFDNQDYRDQDKASATFSFAFGGDSDLGEIDKEFSTILPLSASARKGVVKFKNMLVKARPDSIVVLELEIKNVLDTNAAEKESNMDFVKFKKHLIMYI